jgi:prevent-host-death family protein
VRTVGVRELKAHASRILREVRERGEEVQVTSRGEVVARLLPPAESRDLQEDFDAIWEEMDRLAEEIGRRWPEGISGVEALSEDRR